MTSQEIICVRCNLPQAIRNGKWFARCTRKSCVKSGVNLVLAPIESGKMYVQIICKKGIIRRVDEKTTIVCCSCCKDEPTEFAVDDSKVEICNGEKLFGTVALTGFIRRRMNELREAKEKVEAVEEGLKKLGIPVPILKKKQEEKKGKEAEKIKSRATKMFKTACNGCGNIYSIPPGFFTVSCKNAKCHKDKFVCRPVPTGVKYVLISCKKKILKAAFEKSTTVSCSCCERDFVIDNVLYKIMSGQPVYKAEPVTGFTQKCCKELMENRRKLKYAEAELRKHKKEPSFWKKLFSSMKTEPKNHSSETFDKEESSEAPSAPPLFEDEFYSFHCGKHNEGFLESPEDLPPLCNLSMSSLRLEETRLRPKPAVTRILTDPTTALENLNLTAEAQPEEGFRISLQLHSLASYEEWLHDSSTVSCGTDERLIE